jgi:hypothetical protein
MQDGGESRPISSVQGLKIRFNALTVGHGFSL